MRAILFSFIRKPSHLSMFVGQSPITNHQSTNHQSPITNHQSPIHQSPIHQSTNHQSTNHQSPTNQSLPSHDPKLVQRYDRATCLWRMPIPRRKDACGSRRSAQILHLHFFYWYGIATHSLLVCGVLDECATVHSPWPE